MSLTSNRRKRYNEKLTEIAKNIFGEDIVDSAYVTTWDLMSPKGEIIKRIEKESEHYSDSNPDCKPNEIDTDSKEIVVTFKNGKSVEFSSSEWGAVRSCNIEDYKDI